MAMASNLKVDQLRDELSKRGLSTAGIKPTLVKRLESAIRKESLPLGESSNRLEKRERENSEDGDFNQKIRAIDDLRNLSIKQLRQQASLRGVSTGGSKKQLLQRLCTESQTNNEDIVEEIEEEEDTKGSKQEQLVTATKKGSAVLDPWIPDHVKSHYHVLQQGNEIYDATLNQTNVGENNNKFYIIQALESDDGSTFMVYNRWGRVGMKGQDKLHGPYTCAQAALDEFEQKFYAKTKNHWLERKDFVSYPRSYTWLEMDYSEAGKETTYANSRQLSPSGKILLESQPPELRQRLFNIFGQRTPSFPRQSDGRSNRKSSRSSDASSHRRSSDASIHKPYFDITLKKELEDAITDLVFAKDLDFKDVAQVDSILSSSEMTAKVFMRADRNGRISLIQDMLKR